MGDDVYGISLDIIPDGILLVLGFQLFTLGYSEEGMTRFVDVTDEPKLTIERESVDNGQPITDSKNEKLKKKLEYAAKRKAKYNNQRALMQASGADSTIPLTSQYGLSTWSLFYSLPALLSYTISTLLFHALIILLSHIMPASLSSLLLALLSHFIPALSSFTYTTAAGSSLSTLVFCLATPTTSSSHSMLGLASTHIIS